VSAYHIPAKLLAMVERKQHPLCTFQKSKYSDVPQGNEVVNGQDRLCPSRSLFSDDTRITFLTSTSESTGVFVLAVIA